MAKRRKMNNQFNVYFKVRYPNGKTRTVFAESLGIIASSPLEAAVIAMTPGKVIDTRGRIVRDQTVEVVPCDERGLPSIKGRYKIPYADIQSALNRKRKGEKL